MSMLRGRVGRRGWIGIGWDGVLGGAKGEVVEAEMGRRRMGGERRREGGNT